MKPLFFGSAERRLYGIHHPPASGAPVAGAGVLLCYPGVQEYAASHPTFRRLTTLLTQRGFHVFRFDYFGTGDSQGSAREGRLSLWVEDVRNAATKLLELSGVRAVSVVGARLGGAIAYEASADGLELRDLVLWEPVVTGHEYIAELEDWDEKTNLGFLHSPRGRRRQNELLGYSFPLELRRAIETLELCRSADPKADGVTLVVAEPHRRYERLQDTLSAGSVPVTVHVVPNAWQPFFHRPDASTPLVPDDVLGALADTLTHEAVS